MLQHNNSKHIAHRSADDRAYEEDVWWKHKKYSGKSWEEFTKTVHDRDKGQLMYFADDRERKWRFWHPDEDASVHLLRCGGLGNPRYGNCWICCRMGPLMRQCGYCKQHCYLLLGTQVGGAVMNPFFVQAMTGYAMQEPAEEDRPPLKSAVVKGIDETWLFKHAKDSEAAAMWYCVWTHGEVDVKRVFKARSQMGYQPFDMHAIR